MYTHHPVRLNILQPDKMKSLSPVAKIYPHPIFFALITFTVSAELGLTAFLIVAGFNSNYAWTGPRYRFL